MTQTIHIMTRGQEQDYTFLIVPPKMTWWTLYNQTETVTKFENPTCILESTSAGWRLYLSGIPSTRRDPSARVIRYTLVIEDDGQGSSLLEIDQLLNLIQIWLTEVSEAAGQIPAHSQLGQHLDTHLDVESLLRHREQKPDLLTRALMTVPTMSVPVPPTSSLTTSWWGSLQNPQSRQDWMYQVKQLLSRSQQGCVCVLNLINAERVSSLIQATDAASIQVVLIRSGNFPPQSRKRTASSGWPFIQRLIVVSVAVSALGMIIYVLVEIILPNVTILFETPQVISLK